MKVTLGKKGCEKTWQYEFPKTTKCWLCKGTARIGFVAYEGMEKSDSGPLVSGLHLNKGKGKQWLHDCCAVAVYFCKECLNPTALYNQG
uniref:Uncharacterized protein n=1 Tax=viral metagenome TaxID=1070528 RepID=A0A6M3KXA1_9ZZZZ